MIKVTYTQEFLPGHTLAGMEYEGRLSFTSISSAMRWVDGVINEEERNGWRLLKCSFEVNNPGLVTSNEAIDPNS